MTTNQAIRSPLTRTDTIPEALLQVEARDLAALMPGPTLFSFEGHDPQPLFVSVLLHGNEDTGWDAIRAVLRHYQNRRLPRSLMVFVGNIEAAAANMRTLPHQVDYNRAWPGTSCPECLEAALMRDVVDAVAARNPFASIDVHNNTGSNPHYGCVNRLDEPTLHLASLFSRVIVYFTEPVGVQSAAMSELCPAVTLECGKPGVAAGAEHAADLIKAALAMSTFPDHPVPEHDIDILQTYAILKVPADASFSFDGSEADFRFRDDLDHLNFSELTKGAVLGALGGEGTRRLSLETQTSAVVAGASHSPVLGYEAGEIRLLERAIPAMLSLDPNAVRLDCLGYLMRRIDRSGRVHV